MGAFNPDYVPMLMILSTVLPVSFETFREILEDRFELEGVMHLYLVRFIEFVLALAFLPTATVVIILMLSLKVLTWVLNYSLRTMDFLSSAVIIWLILYYINLFIVVCFYLVILVILLQFGYDNLTGK